MGPALRSKPPLYARLDRRCPGIGVRRALALAAILAGPGCVGEVGAPAAPESGAGPDGVPTGPCSPDGQVAPCYAGSPATQGIGACQAGAVTCADGVWGPCLGAVLPADERCGDGVDDDCNGTSDEGCGCETGQSQACYAGPASTPGIGACREGVQQCIDGVWGAECAGAVEPTAETCDQIDNDCNGILDDGCACTDGQTVPCYGGPPATEDVGLCRGGSLVCKNGQWPSVCAGQVVPASEQCNGEDDDCDGKTDEGDPGGGQDCQTGQPGVCAAGTSGCVGGSLLCEPFESASSEQCNGEDDDCDGKIDNGNPGGGGSCPTGQAGVCAAGSYQCAAGVIACQPVTPAKPESCNGLDDDCDGPCDEAASCRIGIHRSYDSGSGQHFYTASASEAACCGFTLEAQNFYYLAGSPVPGTVAYYRCYVGGSAHLYTQAADCEGTTKEGVLGYIGVAPGCGAVPLYRLALPSNGDHFYATSATERDQAQAEGYQYEGVSGYVWLDP